MRYKPEIHVNARCHQLSEKDPAFEICPISRPSLKNFSLVHHLMVCTSNHWLQTVRRETSTYAETLRGQDVVPDVSVLNAPRLPHPAPSGSGIGCPRHAPPPTARRTIRLALSPSSSMGSYRRLVNKFDSFHIGCCLPPVAGV
jgi:hypothetical protein